MTPHSFDNSKPPEKSNHLSCRKSYLFYLLQEALKQRRQRYDWSHHARTNQKPPQGPWKIWLIMAGRGFGKTRTGAETIRHWAQNEGYQRIGLVGKTLEEVRHIMIEGKSGLLSVCSPEENVKYFSSKRKILWPNGAIATAYSAENPEQLRGPQFDAFWIDEMAKFNNPQEIWNQVSLSLRLGKTPRIIITTTPKACPFLRWLIQQPDCVITQGSSLENQKNLAPSYIENLEKHYKETSLWEQEIMGKLLNEKSGIWRRSWIRHAQPETPLTRVLVALDPAVTHHEKSDETGIIVAGIDSAYQAYVLEDLSGTFSPSQWMERAVNAYRHYRADTLVAEINQGGTLIEHLLRSLYPHDLIHYQAVQAKENKIKRAEMIAFLYQQGKVFHMKNFETLENQLCGVHESKSPDRMDALVWGLRVLFFHSSGEDHWKKPGFRGV